MKHYQVAASRTTNCKRKSITAWRIQFGVVWKFPSFHQSTYAPPVTPPSRECINCRSEATAKYNQSIGRYEQGKKKEKQISGTRRIRAQNQADIAGNGSDLLRIKGRPISCASIAAEQNEIAAYSTWPIVVSQNV